MNTSSVGTVGERGPLSWSRTVERELVHRTSVAEVLLTDVRRAGTADAFEAAASWPRAHTTFPRDGSQRHSPLVLVETLRQLGLYVPLRFHGVPAACHAIITDLYFRLCPESEPPAGPGATEITCRARVSDVRRARDGSVTGLRLDVAFAARGAVFGRGGGGVRFVAGAGYAALRARSTPGPASPLPRTTAHRPAAATLTVNHPQDAVLAEDGDGLLVAPADPLHPFLFDHPTDHAPGIVLLEAARQAVAHRSRGALARPCAGRLKAVRFTELAPPARVLCIGHHSTWVFRIVQDGTPTAYGTLSYP
ncbi:ScbA/BarX family gamma-butyrolactone biosynthesis protein [Streptomyces yunnanensis]|uniref:A-factor biosynthesis hotdog domain-containing protein n=1 Tax=Streptomyces yunnanensis TaxID=156453 RepID=A0A9X8N727_9ACTN|nr:ScbA/BarX family gamma-butyrolactone biosynthesis protein [Streptomyces yunnanensis]SHN20010.1 A-factor biosynthesis hotdog domain-containing protein [Streptomyces yunnanensis]